MNGQEISGLNIYPLLVNAQNAVQDGYGDIKKYFLKQIIKTDHMQASQFLN